jgi:hypothetical protein
MPTINKHLIIHKCNVLNIIRIIRKHISNCNVSFKYVDTSFVADNKNKMGNRPNEKNVKIDKSNKNIIEISCIH